MTTDAEASGVGCPSWCRDHAQQLDTGGDRQNVYHRSPVLGWGDDGAAWLTRPDLTAESLPATITVSGTDGGSLYDIDAAGARQLAALMTELADALEAG